MGIEKNLNGSRAASKASSVDLYRPPALRNRNSAIDATPLPPTAAVAVATTIATAPDVFGNAMNPTKTQPNVSTSVSCSNLPKHTNENSNHGIAVSSHAPVAPSSSSSPATVTTIQSDQKQRQTVAGRRERRPDRAVYIPRARRSQTTPPTTTTASTIVTTTTTATTKATAAAMTTTPQSPSPPLPASAADGNHGNNHGQNEQQSVMPVGGAHSTKSDTSSNGHKVPMRKLTKANIPSTSTSSNNNYNNSSNSMNSSSRQSHPKEERKERPRKSIEPRLPRVTTPAAAVVVPTSRTSTSTPNELSDHQAATIIVISRGKQPATAAGTSSLRPSSHCDSIRLSQTILGDFSDLATSNHNNLNDRNMLNNNKSLSKDIEAPDLCQLRIEDVASDQKCDIDAKELERATKAMNRINRRIMKQTFISDVLEIPDQIEIAHDASPKISLPAKPRTQRQQPSDSATEEVEDELELKPVEPEVSGSRSRSGAREQEPEEDSWENMFDESGECLDPKVLQELTAAVGKVKIELPKMDYNLYLSKQNILNEEEFPHVLEVSNFPIEFKNQDLMMLFSQYKETGFDIKWVDDTHALAVFSSSRIAAEALTMGHPFVVLKPLAEATFESRLKAKKCAASLQPYRPRPETCPALARRLVSGALGVRLKTAAAERENEKRVLRAAKERKLLAAKQRDEAWES